LTAVAVGFGWMALDPEIMTDLAAWLFFPVTIAFFGGIGLSLLIAAARHPVALRVDHDGVTLGRAPVLLTQHGFWWRTPRVTVPWQDIDAVPRGSAMPATTRRAGPNGSFGSAQ
jgi:hypothetical protein